MPLAPMTMRFSRDEARQPLTQKPEAIVAGGMQNIYIYKSDPVAFASNHGSVTGDDENQKPKTNNKAVLVNAMRVTSCPVIQAVAR